MSITVKKTEGKITGLLIDIDELDKDELDPSIKISRPKKKTSKFEIAGLPPNCYIDDKMYYEEYPCGSFNSS